MGRIEGRALGKHMILPPRIALPVPLGLAVGLVSFASLALPAKPRVSQERLGDHVRFLGDDARRGRAPGTVGALASARYIAARLEDAGLEPKGTSGTWFQDVPLHGTIPEPTTELVVSSACGSRSWKLGEDYVLFTGGLQTLIPRDVPLVFAGYGIVAPEFDYNDYQDLDVAGKVVVILTGEPVSRDPDYFGGERPTIHSTAEAKQRVALSRGARGSLLVDSGLEPAPAWGDLRIEFAFEHLSLPHTLPRHMSARVAPRAAEELFCGGERSLAEVRAMEKDHTLQSFPLAARFRFRGAFSQRDFYCRNVLGLLEGSDRERADSYVVVSAHYDHLGEGPAAEGDGIYNGVVDNAIGVAGALEIARVLAARPEPPARSILFLFPTAEEEGLLGTLHYLDHPAVPVHRTVANVNVDGLAHVDTFEDVVGIGAEASTLGRALERAAAGRGLQVSVLPADARADSFAYSDQAAFAEAGVPALLVNEGLQWTHHAPADARALFVEWMLTRYHRPSDDLSQPLNLEATAEHVELLVDLVAAVADEPEAPEWHPGRPEAISQLRALAEGR